MFVDVQLRFTEEEGFRRIEVRQDHAYPVLVIQAPNDSPLWGNGDTERAVGRAVLSLFPSP